MVIDVFLCPYCFNKFDIDDAEYHCNRCDEDVKPRYDRKSKRMTCSSCGEPVYKRICPKCGSDLPRGIEESGDTIIAVVGPKGVGKSQFITVLISELKNSFSVEFEASLSFATEKTQTKYNLNCDYLYGRHEVVPETNSITGGNDDVKEPYILYLKKRSNKKLFGGSTKCVTLVFYDTAGEDLNDTENIMDTKIGKYLGNATGIIYLVDPLQIPYIRSRCDANNPPPMEGKNEASIVLDRICEAIRESKRMSISQPITTKLAVVLTKSDLLKKSNNIDIRIDESSAIRIERKRGQVDLENLDMVSDEIREYLNRTQNASFTNQVTANYKQYEYFMVSSLGHDPLNGSLNGNPSSERILDPIIWLLHATGSGIVK